MGAVMEIKSERVDIKKLGCILNAAANKGDVNSIQIIGRCVRQIEGKKDAYYIDFSDHGVHTRRHSRARVEAFRNEGHEVLFS